MSCPYIKYDENKNCEVCKLTKKPTGISLVCDFDYEEKCDEYKVNSPKLKELNK